MGIVSGGGGGAAGVSSSTVIQTGSGSPVGAVTPSRVGAIYQDLTNGAIYLARSTTSADWIVYGNVAGNVGETTGLAFLSAARNLYVLAGERDAGATNVDLFIGTSYSQWNGHGQGVKWSSGGAEGAESLSVQTGTTGQFVGTLQDGSGNATLPGIVTNKGTRTQAIASGALPTVQLVSATGAQILTTRDADTITPCTFNPGAATTATVTVALSPDNVTYSTLGVETEPAGVAFDGTIHLVKVRVPAAWYLKLTVNAQAVLGLTTYY